MTTRLPKSVRKFIRKEKARIRKEVLDKKEQEKLIQELYQKFLKQYENKRNTEISN
jgi:molybdopterin converting factor small subunit